MTYRPKPVDTTHIELPPEIVDLTEWLAANIHDVWAGRRLAQGWQYGPQRDDQHKEHPSLKPYDELSQEEREYDRQTALQTIRALLASGWNLTRPGGASEPARLAAALAELHQALRDPAGGGAARLASLWARRDRDLWAHSPRFYEMLADRMLRAGEPLMAYDVVREGLNHFCAEKSVRQLLAFSKEEEAPRTVRPQSDLRLRQLLALSLLRGGASSTAGTVLQQVYDDGRQDEETLGLLGRTHKDLADSASNGEERTHHLRSAEGFYVKAYDATRGYWSGINAATLALVLGERVRAEALARHVREQCLGKLETESEGDECYWLLATLGEAALILNDWDEAEARYHAAAEIGRANYGSLHSSRRNARLLMDHLDGDRDRIEHCFHIPAVVVFAGHMIDQPNRSTPRFPPALEEAVKQAIGERLRKIDGAFGYASAACGSDILFLETVLDLGGEAQVVLPYDRGQFRGESVDIIPGAGWAARYDRILDRVAGVTEASFQRLEAGGTLYEYANLMLYGLARARARQLDTRLVPLAVWDGEPGDGPAGTASVVERWRSAGLEVEVIPLQEILRERLPDFSGRGGTAARPRAAPARQSDPEIRSLLFADAVGFSKLTEAEVPLFVEHFLGLVGGLIAASPNKPLIRNTWGDGLYFVFANVRDAGLFALELCERIAATDWKKKGLRDLNLRIGLHAGPVYQCIDPVTEQKNYIGAHVSRAARIEPITPPGHVYASQGFAALAAVDDVREFACDYVGRIEQAKGYGTFATYVVRRVRY
jgi:class 3 adenylate cyclase